MAARAQGIDVLVLGGGAAGCATALSLVGRGLDPSRVLVAEASEFERERIGESIPPDTGQLFEALGVLRSFQAQGHESCLGSASSWGDDELGFNDFVYNPHGSGWHLDRRRFDAWLADEVERRGVCVRRGLKFLDVLEKGPSGFVVELGSRASSSAGARREVRRERVAARFVVDATGARSLFARRMGAVPRTLDLLVSVAAFFRLPEESKFAKLTYLEAVEYGWWYTARLPDQRIATAVATSHELHKELRFDQAPNWLEALSRTRHLAPVLAECEPIARSFSVCTAPSFILDEVRGEDWLAVGDAASAFDPISSQGIHKALSDGLTAGGVIAAEIEPGLAQGEAVDYRAAVTARFEEYVRQRGYLYGLEERWPDAPFWRGRRAADRFAASGRV